MKAALSIIATTGIINYTKTHRHAQIITSKLCFGTNWVSKRVGTTQVINTELKSGLKNQLSNLQKISSPVVRLR